MALSRSAVVATAVSLLDRTGLPGFSMRKLADELGVQQSAIYWHFENKQSLLAAMADEVLDAGMPKPHPNRSWPDEATEWALALRQVLLAHRDAAELLSSTLALGLGGQALMEQLAQSLEAGGLSEELASIATHLLVPFVVGYTFTEQQRAYGQQVGVAMGPAVLAAEDPDGVFAAAIAIVINGLQVAAQS